MKNIGSISFYIFKVATTVLNIRNHFKINYNCSYTKFNNNFKLLNEVRNNIMNILEKQIRNEKH